MSIANRFVHLFPNTVRKAGDHYFRNGNVVPFYIDPEHFFANVQGSDIYTVGLDYIDENHDLGVSCECPYYNRSGPCKHIWAAMRTADVQGGLLLADHSATSVSLVEPNEMDEIITANNFLDVRNPGRRETSSKAPKKRVLPPPIKPKKTATTRKRGWQEKLKQIRTEVERSAPAPPLKARTLERESFYIINVPESLQAKKVVINIGFHERLKNGEWGKIKFQKILATDVPLLPDEHDRKVLSLLLAGASEDTGRWAYYSPYQKAAVKSEYQLEETATPLLLSLMNKSGRLCLSMTGTPKAAKPISYDPTGQWETRLKIEPALTKSGRPSKSTLKVGLELICGETRLSLSTIEAALPAGLIFDGEHLEQMSDPRHVPLLQTFINAEALEIPTKSLDTFLKELSAFPIIPPIETPDGKLIEATEIEPQPALTVLNKSGEGADGTRIPGSVQFNYNGIAVTPSEHRRTVLDPTNLLMIHRDTPSEHSRLQELKASGFDLPYGYNPGLDEWQITPKKFAKAVRNLTLQGWLVEAEGNVFRANGALNLQVSSGIDWFDLQGNAQFDEASISFPELLRAIKHGEKSVLLDDGSYGVLPEEWIARYSNLAKSVKAEGDALRFSANQVILLDILLAELPEAQFDETFVKARERLHSFEGVGPENPPDSFQGELRPYQKVGLGWFRFLRTFGFGGCLADDMGLGKTVQALALLEDRRIHRHFGTRSFTEDDRPKAPSLAVVPKSLIFNWIEEAKRFSPELKVLDYTGSERKNFRDRFDEFDLILTTYGTLRRDIAYLRMTEFDYLILDESQAIKNEKSATAKSARLLRGTHRLAMSGTPIENRIDELWSLFEFLNPGMLGTATLFNTLATASDSGTINATLSQSVRPFILRRTKEAVAKDLPEKVEQTLYVELDKTQRKLYNELRDHFRADVLSQIDSVGMNRSKIKVLEALLRLRQAACHPGLIDKKKVEFDSAKLTVLVPQLEEIVQEGHKALVFSQFTSFLGLLQKQLDKNGIPYAYLDGKTRDRQTKVDKFQNDPDCPLFLISLKAGGVGLNLTAAEYVFLLDPWWNPAVEAQAIDRTHRIGQKNNVFAYRLIARNTVEEKVLELQEEKRMLAESIITGDNALIRNLAREDLELLLS